MRGHDRRQRRTARRGVAILVLLAAGPLAACSSQASAPRNVIVLVGDGMSYNQIDLASLYEHGTANWQVQGDPSSGVQRVPGSPSQAFEDFDVQLAVATYPDGGEYEAESAWEDFAYVDQEPTDSAAAATAMSTGVKTYNAAIGVDPDGDPAENLSERASALGRAAGVVTTVPFSHATPAGFAAHDVERDHFNAISQDYLGSDLSVVMGAGHPMFTDDHTSRPATYKYITEASWAALTEARTPFSFIDDTGEFTALASAEDPPDRVFGVAQVASSLQQERSGDTAAGPFEVPLNDVPDLATMTRAALNVLGQDPDGLFLMVEGGAIDKAAHDNQAGRVIEEAVAFNDAVEAVLEWVEAHSSWQETLVVVTADHETGHLTAPGSEPGWSPLTGVQGAVPTHEWHSDEHTNSLVPLFAKGVGAERLTQFEAGVDPVRGPYIENTALARLLLDELWAQAN